MSDPKKPPWEQYLAELRARFCPDERPAALPRFAVTRGEGGRGGEPPREVATPSQSPRPVPPPANPTIPPFYQWAKLTAPDLRRRVVRDTALADGQAALSSPALVLVGQGGCGKTSLACALLHAWEARHPRRRAVFAAAWSLGAARGHNGWGHGEAPEVERAKCGGPGKVVPFDRHGNGGLHVHPLGPSGVHEEGLPHIFQSWTAFKNFGEDIYDTFMALPPVLNLEKLVKTSLLIPDGPEA
jgi:hypothetical protein